MVPGSTFVAAQTDTHHDKIINQVQCSKVSV